jgi:hypothetical protein
MEAIVVYDFGAVDPQLASIIRNCPEKILSRSLDI